MNMKGMSPRKQMAMGSKGESFGVKSYESMHGGAMHPDQGMSHAPMDDGSRGIGGAIHHTKGHLPAQAAPNHGPTHHKGHMDHHTKG